MQSDDVCMVSVATFNRWADRYAEKYFNLDKHAAFCTNPPNSCPKPNSRLSSPLCPSQRAHESSRPKSHPTRHH